ncbi:MAG: enoyl-CoA hydratase-related protein [Parvibaculales bacterium]
MAKPVIVGIGEIMKPVPKDLAQAEAPVAFMAQAAQRALENTNTSSTNLKKISTAIDTVAVVRTFSDSGAPLKSPFGDPENYPRAVAKRLGIKPQHAIYAASGGQAPQQLVNEFASKITQGQHEVVLLVGAEALANQKALLKAGQGADWHEPSTDPFEDRDAGIAETLDEGQFLNEFINIPAIYTAMENARRRRLGLNRAAYRSECAALFEQFAKVAATHPCAMFPTALSAQEIETITPENNAITDLYSRAMTAKDGVNLGAAVLMMSAAAAQSFGIDPAHYIYPIAGSDTVEKTLSQRADIGQSVAMQAAYDGAFEAAELTHEKIKFMDLYSCFPLAVFVACEALQITPDDPRGLTVTGGLPFFGGPGNNYAMHAIVNMAQKLRQEKRAYGLVGANGGFLSKHSVGIYSTHPPEKGWQEADKAKLKKIIDAQETPEVAAYADGRAQIEAYAVEFNRKGPVRGFVLGRLGDDRRFIGSTDRADKTTLAHMLDDDAAADPLDKEIYVTSKGPGNRFSFAPETTLALMPKIAGNLDADFKFCEVTRHDHILEVTINRPEARNSLTPEANFELEQIFDLYEQDRSLWVAIITGAGDKAFSAGNDLKYMATGNPIWIPETGFGGLTHRQNRTKPVIAAVNGFAFGGGLEIALACDLIVADANAQFALPEVKTGLIAGAGGIFRLPQKLPAQIANEMILTGRAMKIDEACHYGLVNVKAEAGAAMTAARDLAKTICAVSPSAVSASLQAMQAAAHHADPIDALKQPSNALIKVAISEDLQAGLTAFMLKQKPNWKNK